MSHAHEHGALARVLQRGVSTLFSPASGHAARLAALGRIGTLLAVAPRESWAPALDGLSSNIAFALYSHLRLLHAQASAATSALLSILHPSSHAPETSRTATDVQVPGGGNACRAQTDAECSSAKEDTFSPSSDGHLQSTARLPPRLVGALSEALYESELCLRLLPGLVLAHQASADLSALPGMVDLLLALLGLFVGLRRPDTLPNLELPRAPITGLGGETNSKSALPSRFFLRRVSTQLVALTLGALGPSLLGKADLFVGRGGDEMVDQIRAQPSPVHPDGESVLGYTDADRSIQAALDEFLALVYCSQHTSGKTAHTAPSSAHDRSSNASAHQPTVSSSPTCPTSHITPSLTNAQGQDSMLRPSQRDVVTKVEAQGVYTERATRKERRGTKEAPFPYRNALTGSASPDTDMTCLPRRGSHLHTPSSPSSSTGNRPCSQTVTIEESSWDTLPNRPRQPNCPEPQKAKTKLFTKSSYPNKNASALPNTPVDPLSFSPGATEAPTPTPGLPGSQRSLPHEVDQHDPSWWSSQDIPRNGGFDEPFASAAAEMQGSSAHVIPFSRDGSAATRHSTSVPSPSASLHSFGMGKVGEYAQVGQGGTGNRSGYNPSVCETSASHTYGRSGSLPPTLSTRSFPPGLTTPNCVAASTNGLISGGSVSRPTLRSSLLSQPPLPGRIRLNSSARAARPYHQSAMLGLRSHPSATALERSSAPP